MEKPKNWGKPFSVDEARYNQKVTPRYRFSASDDLKFTLGGLLVLLWPLILIGLIVLAFQ